MIFLYTFVHLKVPLLFFFYKKQRIKYLVFIGKMELTESKTIVIMDFELVVHELSVLEVNDLK